MATRPLFAGKTRLGLLEMVVALYCLNRVINLPAKSDMTLPKPCANWALFLDFDGTLVEIADQPEAVSPDTELSDLLRKLEHALGGALAVITGRPIEQLDRMLKTAVKVVAGHHGHELRTPDGVVHRHDISHDALATVHPELDTFVAAHEGLLLEDKGQALALHFRQAPALEEACDRLARRLAGESGGELVVLCGKMVREIKADGHDKGGAVAFLMGLPPFAGRLPVYAGDDVTDEDAFAVVNDLGGLTIKVGEGNTRAAFRAAAACDLRRWLSALTRSALGAGAS